MISIIICSAQPARLQAVSAQWKRVMERAGEPWEIVAIHGPRSLCDGYQQGMAASRGEILIFSHDDIEIWTDDFVPRLKRYLTQFDGVGVAGTSKLVGTSWLDAGPPYLAGQIAHRTDESRYALMIYGAQRRIVGGMQALDGLMMAFRRKVPEQVGWDGKTFSGFHFYDLDMTYRAHRAGFALAVAVDLHVCHFSGGSYGDQWHRYAQAFQAKHGSTLERIVPRRVVPMGVWMDSKEEIHRVMVAVADALPDDMGPDRMR